MSDNSFIREVDDAVRQERYKALWDRYGIYVVGLALALIIGAVAYNAWVYYEESRATSAGDDFIGALDMERAGDQAKAAESLEALAADGPTGYSILSRFQLASGEAKAGETDKAVAAYEALAKDRNVDPILKGLATLQAATLRLDTADYAEMQQRLGTLASGQTAWRFSARELLGLSAFQNKDIRAAEEQFSALSVDDGAPPNMRNRADVMLALIIAQSATASSSKSADTKDEAAEPDAPKQDEPLPDAPAPNESTTN